MRPAKPALAALAAAAALLAGCAASPPPSTDQGPAPGAYQASFQPIDACVSDQQTELDAVAQNQSQLDALWQQACGGALGGTGSPEPTIDFANATVVGVFWGQKGTTGYSTEVVNITVQSSGTQVRAARDHPGPGCAVAQMVTYPGQLVQAEKLPGPVQFGYVDRQVPC